MPLSIFFYSRIKYLGKYSTFLEDEYYHFINKLNNCKENDLKELIVKATKTGLYKKIHYNSCDSAERFKCMVEDNNIDCNYINISKNRNNRF